MFRDEDFMKRALQLAELGRDQTSPNPMVGAVVVQDGIIVGQGAHLQAGGSHAEVHALTMAGHRAAGSTVYVTLEPCNHHGRTPPCTDALIQAGVKRVVVATEDPNPRVCGSGVAKLREAGIEVSVGTGREEATRQNEAFFTWVRKRRPFVLWKCAATLDGYIATRTGHSQFVTGSDARASVQELRTQFPAIAVGIGTVLADDPRLTVRTEEGSLATRQPLRVIFDSALRMPLSARLLSEPGHTLIYTTSTGAEGRPDVMRKMEESGISTVVLNDGGTARVPLGDALRDLAARGIHSVLVEGGSAISTSLFRERLVDKVVYYLAPKLLGGGLPSLNGLQPDVMGQAIALANVRMAQVGADFRIEGYPVYVDESEHPE